MSIDEVPSSQVREQMRIDEEQDVVTHDQADNRHLEPSRKRILNLAAPNLGHGMLFSVIFSLN